MSIKNCNFCGKEIIDNSYNDSKKYCSQSCSKKYNRGSINKCILCGKPIAFGRSKYCSDVCAKKVKNRRSDVKKREFYHSYKLKKGCAICRYNKCPDALDIHHRGLKESRITMSNFKAEKVQSILKDCIVLCKNCHHELHYKKRFLDI